jgi:hypothetical protein
MIEDIVLKRMRRELLLCKLLVALGIALNLVILLLL